MSRTTLTIALLLIGLATASTMGADWSPWVEAFLGILVVLLILLSRDGLHAESHRSPLFWFSMLLVVMLVVLPWSGEKYASMRTFIYWFTGIGFFFTARTLDREFRQRVLFILVCIAGLGGLWAIINFAAFSNIERAGGFLGNANALGGFAVLFLPLAIGMAVLRKGMQRWIAIFSAACLLIALALSFSLTGMVSLGVAAIIWLALQPRAILLRCIRWALVGCIAVVLLSIGIRFAQTRSVTRAVRLDQVITRSHFNSSFSQRWEFIRVSFAMAQAKPFTGVGIGAYQLSYSQFGESRLEQPRYAHNAYLELAAEGGIIVGLLGLLSFFALGRAIVHSLRPPSAERGVLFAAAVGLLASGLHSVTDFAWHFPGVWLAFWSIAGLVVTQNASPARASSRVIGWVVGLLACFIVIRGVGVAMAYTSLARAEKYLAEENYTSAIVNYRAGLRWDPDPALLAKLANALWLARPGGADSITVARVYGERALWLAPVSYATHIAVARIAVAQKDDARAEVHYQRAIELDRHFHPDVTAEYVNFLRARNQQQKADSLIAEAEQAYQSILKPGEALFYKK
ncbi:MAG: O-antigen ligase family protein [Patescibacteria group bacterium]